MNFRKYLAIGASIVFGFIVGCKSVDSKYPVIPGNEITPMSLENALNKSEHTRFLDLKPRFIDDHLKRAVYSYAHNNLEEALAEMEQQGVQLIDRQPRKGAEGLDIAFLHPRSTFGVLTELCEDKKEGQ